jgi:hypothetical protein
VVKKAVPVLLWPERPAPLVVGKEMRVTAAQLCARLVVKVCACVRVA